MKKNQFGFIFLGLVTVQGIHAHSILIKINFIKKSMLVANAKVHVIKGVIIKFETGTIWLL
jgi:hypothetical protein